MATTSTSTPHTVSRRLNVLVYAGKGTTPESVSHVLFTLRRHLTPYYAVLPVTSPSVLISEPWTTSTALLVIPGGADLSYCADLNGEGNRRIRRFVEGGGAYMGFCAGGYYGSSKCEFEVGSSRKGMEVVGSRELAFFPGICRGAAFKGFEYSSEKGARAVKLKSVTESFSQQDIPGDFRSYYNGGGVFVDADKYAEQGIEVLAEYEDAIDVDHGSGRKAAIVFCKIGEGSAILTGPHPEFASINLKAKSETAFFPDLVQKVRSNDDQRNDFIAACLVKVGLKVNREQNVVPPLSSLHLSASVPSTVLDVRHELRDVILDNEEMTLLKDEQDTFDIVLDSALNMDDLKNTLANIENGQHTELQSHVDQDKIIKQLIFHDKDIPSLVTTPQFDHELFYKYQAEYAENTSGADPDFGHWLLYGEVVTSTNSLLEKNPKLLSRLPTGLTAVAGIQVAGRGRGSNVWVSPPGSLMFSMVVKHEISMMTRAPVIFLQYLAAIAVVEGVQTYGGAYNKIPVKIKWPNDVYALEPSFPRDSKTKPPRSSYVKICGILVNSTYSDKTFNAVVGIGLNTTNALPTTSIAALVEKLPISSDLPALSKERLLARIITTFSALYTRFSRTGFDSHLQGLYYKHWLHSEQEVTLESEGGARAVIKGITSDGGMLVAEEMTGARRKIHLQSDFNSFDFLQGLVRRKI